MRQFFIQNVILCLRFCIIVPFEYYAAIGKKQIIVVTQALNDVSSYHCGRIFSCILPTYMVFESVSSKSLSITKWCQTNPFRRCFIMHLNQAFTNTYLHSMFDMIQLEYTFYQLLVFVNIENINQTFLEYDFAIIPILSGMCVGKCNCLLRLVHAQWKTMFYICLIYVCIVSTTILLLSSL